MVPAINSLCVYTVYCISSVFESIGMGNIHISAPSHLNIPKMKFMKDDVWLGGMSSWKFTTKFWEWVREKDERNSNAIHY